MSPIRGGILHLPTSQEGRYSQSLERGLAILRAFTPERPWMGIAEIAAHLEMSRPTIHRYASTLVALNYLEQGRGRKYRLGTRAGDPGRSAVASTTARSIPPQLLGQLRDSSGCTASLAVLDGKDIVYVDRARSTRGGRSEVDARLGRGSRLPAAATALGRALLAEPKRREAIAGCAEHADDLDGLMSELDRVRSRGIAVADQLRVHGQVCVAAPVRSKSGEAVAAVDVAAAKSDYPAGQARERFGLLVSESAARMSAELGYSPDS
ncbi:MAG TPA: IclR family transcriptional regulator [Solirubrobacteraceae bacterium]|nr:IclR family transcriptional regulator [Solirubrobacteraceae bacterium]